LNKNHEATVLVINCGSSSIKMALISQASGNRLAESLVERLGQKESLLRWHTDGREKVMPIPDAGHEVALQQQLDMLNASCETKNITAVGHRIVHGGERFIEPTLLNAAVIDEISTLSHLAPLHNPVNLLGIHAAMNAFPDIPHIAVFDTAFHHAMPPHAYMYAVPHRWYREYGVRRYGFHGTSHHYVAGQAAQRLGHAPDACQLITVHLGNGCSATAVRNGISVDTTMGMTPLEGLVMGSRSGDVDPGLHDYVARQSGKTLKQITDTLNGESGLFGVSEQSNDMRSLLAAEAAGDEQAGLAIDLFCYRLAKSVAGLTVALEHLDGLVFTGGIGEHAEAIRSRTCRQLASIGIVLDEQKNRQHGHASAGLINRADTVPVVVIATDEEKMIARYVYDRLNQRRKTR